MLGESNTGVGSCVEARCTGGGYSDGDLPLLPSVNSALWRMN